MQYILYTLIHFNYIYTFQLIYIFACQQSALFMSINEYGNPGVLHKRDPAMNQTSNKAKLQGLILKYLQMPCFDTAASWRNDIVEKADDLMNQIYMGIYCMLTL